MPKLSLSHLRFLTIFMLFLSLGCSNPDSQTASASAFPPFDVEIMTPAADRDFCYYNYTTGVFESPAHSVTLTGKVLIAAGSTAIPNNMVHVRWSSDLDGVLFEGTPGTDYESTISPILSKGVHTITLQAFAIDAPQVIYTKTIKITNVIDLQAVGTSSSVQLHWSKYEGSGFVSYLIYNGNQEPVAEINDINTLNYENFNLQLATDLPYQVVAKTTNPNEVMGSNIVMKKAGDYIYFPHTVTKIIKDPLRNRLYGIIDKGYNNDGTFGLVIIDTQNFTITHQLLTSHKFSDLDIDPSGNNLYLSEQQTNYITKINLNSLTTSSIYVNTQNEGTAKVEVGNANMLYCVIAPLFSSGADYLAVNMTTGATWVHPYPFAQGDIDFNSVNGSLYIGESNTSSGRLLKMNYANGQLALDTDFPHFPGGVGYPYNYLIHSDDQSRIYWSNYELDPNLNVLREFTDGIQACSPNNQLLVDWTKVYHSSDLSVAMTFPLFPVADLYRLAVFTDNQTLIIGRASVSNDDDSDYTYFFRFHIN